MPLARMTYPYAREYVSPSTLGHVEPGEERDLDELPDAHWEWVADTETAKSIAARQDTTSTGRQGKRASTPEPTPAVETPETVKDDSEETSS